ncbi:MAG: PD40 domain-containing protein [Flavobacteriaceae bacterium]|nr:PD40 domain-containing protein [Flavobacteriaceae bacterium]
MKKTACSLLLLIGLLGYSQKENFSVVNLSMNNDKPHFGLVVHQNGNVLFTSFVLNKKGKIEKVKGNPILSLFEAQKSKEGELININPLHIDKSENVSHITSASYSPDGSKLYITTNYANRKDKPKGASSTNFHIEVGEYVDGVGWTNFKVLPFCKTRFSYAHPNISPDGKTLYFTANIKGGKETTRGSSDIFKVEILENNTYSTPKNLGSKVNSYSREMFPFMSKDSTLYFASNRPNGFGGYDIYISKMKADNTFEKAVRLPKPVNSNKDDFCFIIDSNNEGYFTSKRTGGKGDDDIYYFKKE